MVDTDDDQKSQGFMLGKDELASSLLGQTTTAETTVFVSFPLMTVSFHCKYPRTALSQTNGGMT
jgi:hypothetical protein